MFTFFFTHKTIQYVALISIILIYRSESTIFLSGLLYSSPWVKLYVFLVTRQALGQKELLKFCAISTINLIWRLPCWHRGRKYTLLCKLFPALYHIQSQAFIHCHEIYGIWLYLCEYIIIPSRLQATIFFFVFRNNLIIFRFYSLLYLLYLN